MKRAGPVEEQVRQVPEVFKDEESATGAKRSQGFGEQRLATVSVTDFVVGEQERHRIERGIGIGPMAIVERVRPGGSGTRDGSLRHFRTLR